MPKIIPAPERIERAHDIIEKARKLPIPEDRGWGDFSYTARVRDLMRQARDMVKFIQYQPGISPELKASAAAIFAETEAVEKELLGKSG